MSARRPRSGLRLSTRYSVLGPLCLLAGCSQQPQPEPPNLVVAAAAGPESTAPDAPGREPPGSPKAEPAQAPSPPPQAEFPFPADAAGKALPAVVTPTLPPPPAEQLGTAPKDRTPPARVVNPEPLAKARYVAPPVLPAKPAGLKPSPPAERVPVDLGAAAVAVPGRPRLPESAGVTAKAPDVGVPPPLPPLARRVPDRAGFDDPTAEAGNAVIANRSPAPSLAPSGFLKIGLPDPFELAEQVKPNVPPAAEPAVTPVPVNPPRPK